MVAGIVTANQVCRALEQPAQTPTGARAGVTVLFVRRGGGGTVLARGASLAEHRAALGLRHRPPARWKRAWWNQEIAAGFFLQHPPGNPGIVPKGRVLQQVLVVVGFH